MSLTVEITDSTILAEWLYATGDDMEQINTFPIYQLGKWLDSVFLHATQPMKVNLFAWQSARNTLDFLIAQGPGRGEFGLKESVQDAMALSVKLTGFLKRFEADPETQLHQAEATELQNSIVLFESQIDPFTRDEAAHVVATAFEQFPDWHPWVLTGLRTGMRSGELLGLQWGDIDWRARTAHHDAQHRPRAADDAEEPSAASRGPIASTARRVASVASSAAGRLAQGRPSASRVGVFVGDRHRPR